MIDDRGGAEEEVVERRSGMIVDIFLHLHSDKEDEEEARGGWPRAGAGVRGGS